MEFKEYENIFKTGPVPYLLYDIDTPCYTILDISDFQLRVLKMKREDVINKPVFESFPPNSEESKRGITSLIEHVIICKTPSEVLTLKYDLQREDHYEERYWNISCYPVFSNDKLRAILMKPDDVTELVALKTKYQLQQETIGKIESELFKSTQEATIANKKLHSLNNELEEASRMKNNFIASMSHDMRTPLNGIIGLTELLLTSIPQLENKYEESTSENLGILSREITTGSPQALSDRKARKEIREWKEYIEIIHTSATSLLALINDILDLSKLQARGITFESTQFNLHKLLREIEQIFLFTIKQKKLVYTSTFPDEKLWVWGDEHRLKQIFTNILGNAVKFTNRGEIKFTVQDTGEDLLFQISDTGIGMSKDELERIFHPFVQANTFITKEFGGTGLGLWISKILVDMMGGKIEVTSKLGEGSIFSIKLVLKRAETVEEILPSEEKLCDQILETVHVLVVDDNIVNQKIAKIMINKLGGKVTLANNGKEALDILGEQDIDIIFMDVSMPVLDGVEATRRIRRGEITRQEYKEKYRDIPIVGMTASVGKEAKESFLRAGMTKVVFKPVRLETVKELFR